MANRAVLLGLDSSEHRLYAEEGSNTQQQQQQEQKEEEAKTSKLLWGEAFYFATLGGAQTLGMDNLIGNFTPGKLFDANVISVEGEGQPVDLFETDDAASAFQKFLFLGDDRNIQHVFVGGRRVVSKRS